MTTPRPNGLTREDINRLADQGVLDANEARQAMNLINQKVVDGGQPFIQPDDIPRTSGWQKLGGKLREVFVEPTFNVGPVGVNVPSGLAAGGLAAGLVAGPLAGATGAASMSIPGLARLLPALGRAPTAATSGGAAPVGVREMIRPALTAAGAAGGAALTASGVESAMQPTPIPDPTTLRPVDQALGAVGNQPDDGVPELPPATEATEQGVQEGEVRTFEGRRFIWMNGAWNSFDDLERQAAVRASQDGRDAAQRREDRFFQDRQTQMAETRAAERRAAEIAEQREFQREQAEAEAARSQEMQRRQSVTQMMQQMFGIAADPAQRLRFIAANARGGTDMGRLASALGIGGEFQELVGAAGLGADQEFTADGRLARMFGLQEGQQMDFAADPQRTGTVPTLGQVSNLTAEEQAELDAITEVFMGQRLGQVQRQAGKLAPPGGSNLNPRVR